MIQIVTSDVYIKILKHSVGVSGQDYDIAFFCPESGAGESWTVAD
jgi:hypothetical protein